MGAQGGSLLEQLATQRRRFTMGLFDFLRGKSKTEEGTANPKGIEAEQIEDADGNSYTTVKIGNQVWTVENLRTTRYNDGTPVPLISDKSKWSACAANKEPACCWYDNDSSNTDRYGMLYNWHVVNTGKLAPKGWHVPTDVEWAELEGYLIANGYNWDGTREGNKIAKSMAAKLGWESDNGSGTIGNNLSMNNRSGFAALPGGSRGSSGAFHAQNQGTWWSATEGAASIYAYRRYLVHRHDSLIRGDYLSNEGCGYSVRLLKD
jgi:uncharacterized protein (TIGR02145 family)